MTVAELIEKLKTFDPNAKVVAAFSPCRMDGYIEEVTYAEIRLRNGVDDEFLSMYAGCVELTD